MANKFIKAAELPANFDIQKYSICARWTLGDWASNLAYRLIRKECIEGSLPYGDTQYLLDMQRACSEAFDDPMLEWGSDVEGPMPLNDEPWPAFAQRVRDVTCLEYLRSHELFSQEEFARYTTDYDLASTAADTFYEWQQSPDATEESWDAYNRLDTTPEWAMWKECVGAADFEFSPFALASVDLNASDAELMDDFGKWLVQARKSRGIIHAAEQFSQSQMQQWAKMRILAYVDLSLWLLAHRRKATLTVTGRALFPDEFEINLEDRTRKVVAEYVRPLMTGRVIRAMQSQHLKSGTKNQ